MGSAMEVTAHPGEVALDWAKQNKLKTLRMLVGIWGAWYPPDQEFAAVWHVDGGNADFKDEKECGRYSVQLQGLLIKVAIGVCTGVPSSELGIGQPANGEHVCDIGRQAWKEDSCSPDDWQTLRDLLYYGANSGIHGSDLRFVDKAIDLLVSGQEFPSLPLPDISEEDEEDSRIHLENYLLRTGNPLRERLIKKIGRKCSFLEHDGRYYNAVVADVIDPNTMPDSTKYEGEVQLQTPRKTTTYLIRINDHTHFRNGEYRWPPMSKICVF